MNAWTDFQVDFFVWKLWTVCTHMVHDLGLGMHDLCTMNNMEVYGDWGILVLGSHFEKAANALIVEKNMYNFKLSCSTFNVLIGLLKNALFVFSVYN